jgi:hypothetical protein
VRMTASPICRSVAGFVDAICRIAFRYVSGRKNGIIPSTSKVNPITIKKSFICNAPVNQTDFPFHGDYSSFSSLKSRKGVQKHHGLELNPSLNLSLSQGRSGKDGKESEQAICLLRTAAILSFCGSVVGTQNRHVTLRSMLRPGCSFM